ncbi:isochorismatase family protein [Mesorhizobium sp. SB112]
MSALFDHSTNLPAIPELAAHWKKLDLAAILRRPAAFMSISQTKSLYEPWGAQARERQWERGNLEATLKVVAAARKQSNFISYSWVGAPIFRDNQPKSAFDKVQFASWVEGLDFSPEKRLEDNELVDQLRAEVRPGDLEFNELALQSAFIGTQLPIELSRKRVEVIVLTGFHLDWCIEGNARAARDNGLLPIVIGDATGTQRIDQQAAAYERINSFFAPVISAADFVRYLSDES